jgi:ribosomal protein L7/L12
LYGDKKKSLDEIDVIKNLIKDWDKSGSVENAYKETKEWFESDKANGNRKQSFDLCVDYLKENLDRFHKPALIDDLMAISKADGLVSEGEATLISDTAQAIGVALNQTESSTATSQPKQTETVLPQILYDVKVNIAETNRVGIIQLYSKLYACDLRTAKEKLSQSPVLFASAIEKSDADKIRELCTALGAEVLVIEHGSDVIKEPDPNAYYDVVLRDPGYNKLAIVVLIKELNNISLKEAKDLTDYLSSNLATNVDYEKAMMYKFRLEAAGAKVELVCN